MRIKLRSLGLPSTSGELLQPSDRSRSGTDFISAGSGVTISEIFYQEKTGVLGGERLGTEHNVWFEFSKMSTLVDVKRGDRLLVNLAGAVSLAIQNITWQSGTMVRLTFEASNYFLQKINIGDYITIASATNASNNGTFIVSYVAPTYIDITNAARTSSTGNETASPAIINNVRVLFDVVDIKKQIFSDFKDHYELNILSPND